MSFLEEVNDLITKIEEEHRREPYFIEFSEEDVLQKKLLDVLATDLHAAVAYFKECPVETFSYLVDCLAWIADEHDIGEEAEEWFLTELVAIENERNADSPDHELNLSLLSWRFYPKPKRKKNTK